MRASNKSTIITGAVLLLLAALFSISLILLPLDYGISGPGHNNIFYILGDMLYSVYGFCSILIPAFLLTAGLSCFASKWTARKTLRLLTALVPFFTCVVTESIIRSVVKVDHSPFAIVKILIALVTGAMLVVIEFLGTGILADRLNNGGFKNLTKRRVAKKSAASDEFVEVIEPEEEIKHDSTDEEAEPVTENEPLPEFKKLSKFKEPKEPKKSFFDRFRKNKKTDDDENEYTEKKPTAFDDVLDNIEEMETETEVQTSTHEQISNKTSENDEPAAHNSMLTQEEFAALTTPEAPADELEWPGLPPKPENLPPEYDADFDENDPALEFPPKDEEPAPEPVNVEPEQFEIEEEETVYEEPAEQAPVTQEPVETAETPVKKTDDANDPYAATRYIDSVVENPLYPHKIVINDDSDDITDEAPVAQPAPEKPKYPTRIQLNDDAVYESKSEPEPEDEYVEDETLPFPNFDIEEPAINSKQNFEEEIEDSADFEADAAAGEANERSVGEYFEEDTAAPQHISKENLYNYFENIDTKKKAPVINEPAFEEENKETDETSNEESHVFNQLAEQEEVNISTAAASVFADMDADIRKTMPAKPKEEPANVSSAAASSHGTGSHGGATNLTKDELSDFFNAQQEENTPKTKEIAANPPKTNRATKKGPYVIPSDLLTAYKDDQYWIIDDATKQASLNLKQTLAEFNIEADIIGIKKGPVVTMFEILPAPGVKLSKIVALQDNIALSLAAQSVRIVAPIPGKQAVGIEVPNRNRSVVGFREIIEMDLPEWKKMAVPVVLGKDILGKAQLIDLVKTPHMLIAGATGSGKSVCVNSLILSILYKRSFEDVKMILVDPKVVELKLYNNIPHLLTPVITEPKKALQALQWCLCEMERRYALLDGMGVRDISNYNIKIREQKICTEKLPYIVVIIDEFADLMATSGKELENIVARLTAMSRAVGIHLVLATQRPSVNVITGLIKANIPTRIAFMVASRTDSNIIIDTVGAEKLLGRGDMLYASAVDPAPIRIQGTFVSDQEVENVVTAVKDYGEPDYLDEEIFTDDDDEEGARDLFGEPMDDDDPLYDQALEIVVQSGKASASYIQRRLKIGYNRAARLVEEMEERGIVGPANGSKPREVIHIP